MIKQPLLLALLSCVSVARAFEPTTNGIYAVFDTSKGEFTARISYEAAPLTAANFIGLAEGTIPRFDPDTREIVEQKRYYDGMIFHRVIKNLAIQAGDPDLDDPDVNGPGYFIPEELHPNLSHNPDYSLSMANQRKCLACEPGTVETGENTTGSQFFITAKALEGQPPAGFGLDGYYSVFGVVVDGKAVVDAIGNVTIDENARPVEDVVINTVTIIRFGEAAEAFHVPQYELPYRIPGPEVEAVAHEDGEVGFEFSAIPGASYPLDISSDLAQWTEAEFINDGDSISKLFVEPNETGATFVRSKAAVREPFDFQQALPNIKMNAIIKDALPGENWRFAFNADGTGTITFEGIGDFKVDYYRFHRLPNGGRIKLSSEELQHEMDIYIKYTSETTGGLFVWIDDYLSGDPVLRYPTTGSFEIVAQ